jgi:hypothetical protein
MKETTFELFARARADQVINIILSGPINVPVREDDPCFQSYYSDVMDLDPAVPVSPSAIFFEACEDKCVEVLTDAKDMLSGYRVIDCQSLEARLNAVMVRLGNLHRRCDEGYVDGFAPRVNCVLEARYLHDAARCASNAQANMDDSVVFFPPATACISP